VSAGALKLAVVGVSRDCFPIDITRRRMKELLAECRKLGLPVIPCSTVSGEGLGPLRDALGRLAADTVETKSGAKIVGKVEKMCALVRELQPGIILNDRLDLPGSADVKTPEEYQPRGWMTVNGQPVVWEACQTFNRSWGYYRDNMDWREPDELIRTLIDTVSKGGNMLLNVGPNGRGEFDERSIERLRAIGAWMRLNSRSIYGCTASDLTPPPDTRFTYNPEKKRLYLHLFAWPYKHVHLDGLAGRVEYAQLLNDASEVKMFTVDPHQQAQNTTMGGANVDTLILELPIAKPRTAVPVVELFLKE